MGVSGGRCDCNDCPFDDLRAYMDRTGASVAQTLHAFHIAQLCAGCLADAMLALGGTQEDMHEFIVGAFEQDGR